MEKFSQPADENRHVLLPGNDIATLCYYFIYLFYLLFYLFILSISYFIYLFIIYFNQLWL